MLKSDCDYRKPQCTNMGTTIDGAWFCTNHLPLESPPAAPAQEPPALDAAKWHGALHVDDYSPLPPDAKREQPAPGDAVDRMSAVYVAAYGPTTMLFTERHKRAIAEVVKVLADTLLGPVTEGEWNSNYGYGHGMPRCEQRCDSIDVDRILSDRRSRLFPAPAKADPPKTHDHQDRIPRLENDGWVRSGQAVMSDADGEHYILEYHRWKAAKAKTPEERVTVSHASDDHESCVSVYVDHHRKILGLSPYHAKIYRLGLIAQLRAKESTHD